MATINTNPRSDYNGYEPWTLTKAVGGGLGQVFQAANGGTIQSATFWLYRYGLPTGDIKVYLYEYEWNTDTVGAQLAVSEAYDAAQLNTTDTGFAFAFFGANQVMLNRGSYYAVVVNHMNMDRSNDVRIMGITGENSYGHEVGYNAEGATGTDPDYNRELCYAIDVDPVPYPGFTADITTGVAPLTVNFTDTSLYSPTSWYWQFGDGSTVTSQNPSHTFTAPGLYGVVLTVANAVGQDSIEVDDYIDAAVPIAPVPITSATALGTSTLTIFDPPPPPPTDWSALGKEDEKVYVYKVYAANGTFIGTWTDVLDDLEFTQRLNTPGTTTTVRLARSANTRKEMRDVRITEDGLDTRITESGDTRVVVYETNNTVGEDTDVDLNYRVDVYVHYGEFAERITEDGDVRITEDGDTRVVTVGAPLGTRIFSGFIMDYESVYGSDAGVTVTLASHGMELSNEIIRTGTTTTVTHSSTALETIAKSILDTNPGTITYSTASIGATGVSESLTFRLNTKLEGIETIYDQTPDGWYWYVSVRENLLYLKQVSSTYDHRFILGEHIEELRIKRSIEDLKNAVYFVGGEVSGTPVFKYYEDAASQTAWRKGIERITDRRYTLAASMQRRADKLMGRYAEPIFTSPLTISSARYDIESIRLGQTVGFRNFDNFIDELPPLQIVSLSYKSTAVTVQLGELQMRQVDEVAQTDRAIEGEQYEKLPNAPS